MRFLKWKDAGRRIFLLLQSTRCRRCCTKGTVVCPAGPEMSWGMGSLREMHAVLMTGENWRSEGRPVTWLISESTLSTVKHFTTIEITQLNKETIRKTWKTQSQIWSKMIKSLSKLIRNPCSVYYSIPWLNKAQMQYNLHTVIAIVV